MVKIAFAGGSGGVASEIINVLAATKKHEILILTRRDPPTSTNPLITYAKTGYTSKDELVKIFSGVHTVLSFIAPNTTQEAAVEAQKNMIDACIQAGVKRFAPSEWVASDLTHMPWYTFKLLTRTYLAEINSQKKVLEYCLFQPGLFTNYMTWPHKSTEFVAPIETPFDFGQKRIVMRKGGEGDVITWTTVKDLAGVVAKAIDYEGEWPVIGGIRGTPLSMATLIALGEELRGGNFKIDQFSDAELADGSWEPSWLPQLAHPSIPPEQVPAASKMMFAGILLAVANGGFKVGDEWNKLLPDYEFTDAEKFLREAWKGKE